MSNLICEAASFFGVSLDRCQPKGKAEPQVADNNVRENSGALEFLKDLLFTGVPVEVEGAVGCKSKEEKNNRKTY